MDAPARRRLLRTRQVVCWILVVLASLLVPLAVATAWTVETTTSTDQYVATMAPLAREAVVTHYVATRATERLFRAVDVEGRIRAALPRRAQFLAAPLAQELRGVVQRQFTRVVDSTWFRHLWDQVNRRAHAKMVDVLTGKVTPGARAHRVVADLTPVLTKGIDALDRRGITLFDGAKTKLAKADTLTLDLASSRQVAKARHAFSAVSTAGWAVPVVAGLLVVMAVVVAVDRRKALLRIAVGAGLLTLALLGALALARAFFVDHAAARAPPEVTGTIFDTIVRYLRDWLQVTVAACAVLALALWLAGPARGARAIRSLVARAVPPVGRRPAAPTPPAGDAAARGGTAGG